MKSGLTKECPTVSWPALNLGVEGMEMCREIVHADTQSGELRSRLGRHIGKDGGCGPAGRLCEGRGIGWGKRPTSVTL